MKKIVEKLLHIEKQTSEEKGPYILFALFLREDSPDRWDLLVSAPWVSEDKYKAIEYLADALKRTLQPAELIRLSRIVPIETDNPALNSLHKAVQVEHGIVEMKNCDFFDMPIRHAYFITSGNDYDSPSDKVMQQTS